MCGYANYNDPRLQPPEGDGEMDAAECWVKCAHGYACQDVLCRLHGKEYSGYETAETLHCDECDQWEEME